MNVDMAIVYFHSEKVSLKSEIFDIRKLIVLVNIGGNKLSKKVRFGDELFLTVIQFMLGISKICR